MSDLIPAAVRALIASQNAERTSITDVSSARASAVDGALTLDTVQAAAGSRRDQILEVTAEVYVGDLSASNDTGDGTLELNCTLPENIELEDCRIDLDTQP